MKKETKRYRNFIKTDTAIKKALIKLYKQHRNINKITIKELCETANISRSTFYLHYNDLISIFESVGDRFIKSLKTMIIEMAKDEFSDFKPYLASMINLINESNELIKIGLSSEYPLAYIDKIKDELESVIINCPMISSRFSEVQKLAEIRIVVSGMISYTIDLIKQQDKIDVEEYSDFLNGFLLRWASTLHLE